MIYETEKINFSKPETQNRFCAPWQTLALLEMTSSQVCVCVCFALTTVKLNYVTQSKEACDGINTQK